MDIYGLAATHFHVDVQRAPMTARAEDRYYANKVARPRFGPTLFGSIAMMAGVILIFSTGLT